MSSRLRRASAVAIAVVWCLLQLVARPAAANVTLPDVFGDNMILQRDHPIAIWGNATPKEKITISIANQTKIVVADQIGHWMVTVGPFRLGPARELVVRGQNCIVLKDVMVGDVWLCSGQSNMLVAIKDSDATREDRQISSQLPLRIYTPLSSAVRQKLKYAGSSWRIIGTQIVSQEPAIPFLFGNYLAREQRVPVGIISCARGGAPIETFIQRETLFRHPPKHMFMPPTFAVGSNYDSMLKPLARFAIRGIVWYQGESNLLNANDYYRLLVTLIKQFRSDWRFPSLPVYIIQLPNFGPKSNGQTISSWAQIRDAQNRSAKLSKVFLVVSVDTATQHAGIHPREKRVIARRLTNLVASTAYGASMSASSPRLRAAGLTRCKLILTFDSRLRRQNDGAIRGFELAGANRVFLPAFASVVGNVIQLWNKRVSKPMFVRYDWADNPEGNVFNSSGLPLSPFQIKVGREFRKHSLSRCDATGCFCSAHTIALQNLYQ